MVTFPLLQSPKIINGIEIGIDPKPDWSFDDLLKELNVLESRFKGPPLVLRSSAEKDSRKRPQIRTRNGGPNSFVVRISSDDELDSDEERPSLDRSLVPAANRFTCPDGYISDEDSEEESMLQVQTALMCKMSVTEGALAELTHEHQLSIKEEIRNQISALETDLLAEHEKSLSAHAQLEKTTRARKEMDRKLDMKYQSEIAVAMDNHLTAVQRDHEHKSQMEERRINEAIEEARRKEKALQEERLRQQKEKAEEEARLEAARKAEEAKKAAAEEAERRAASEAAEKLAKEKAAAAAKEVLEQVPIVKAKQEGNVIRAAESALKIEERRLQLHKEWDEKNQSLLSSSGRDYVNYKRNIARRIKTIRGSIDNVRAKVNELITILNDPGCPQSLSAAMFAREVISICEAPNGDSFVFACAQVIVLVSAQVPLVMDLLLAELYKACMYIVPKQPMYSESVYKSKEAFYKAIGFREEDGKLEPTETYIKRLQSYMTLYGALIQTESVSVKNLHGIEEGWRWLARFLNAIPANRYSLAALEAFLSMAGFALHRRFKSQFIKILNAISRDFLASLKKKGDAQVNSIIWNLESRKFLQEPEGRQLQDALLSRSCVPGQEHNQQNYYHDNSNRYFY